MEKKKLLLVLLLATALIAGTAGAQDVTTGLMGHWKLNDGSGTDAIDSSFEDNDGTLVNGPVWVSGPSGFGGALDFDGINDYVHCGTFVPTTVEDGTLSLCVWIYTDGIQKAAVFAKRSDWAGTSFDLALRSNVLELVRSGASGLYNWCSFIEAVIPANEWTHIVVTVDGTENADSAKAYINGEFIASGLWVYQCPVPDAPVLIGASQTVPSELFGGLIDDVRIYNRVLSQADIDLVLATDTAVNITPANEAELVAIDTDLSWGPPPVFTPTKYDLYYRVGDPNLAVGATVVTDITRTDPCNVHNPAANFAYETTVYWRVDSYWPGASDPCIGDVWSFTTSPPVAVTEDPCSLTVALGGTAVFRVKDIGGVDYTWEKQSDGLPVGDNSSVLTLTNVQQSNEDFYRCFVKNGTDSDYSEWAGLWTKRLIARWEFEDDLEDSEGDWDGVYTDPNEFNTPPTPVFNPSGLEGKALSLVADELHVQITGSEDYFNFYPLGYTVNVWVKTEVSGIWGAIASKQHRGDWPDFIGWVLSCNNEDYASNALRQVFGADAGAAIVGTSNIVDNQWHMVTGTYDAETGTGSIYVDGKLENQLVDTERKAPTNDQPVVIGAESAFGSFSHDGLLDKMSIYSYGLSPIEVAVLYTDVITGEEICVEQPKHDFNGDCKVDLQDFAMFAVKWLECNLVPTCY